MDTAENLDALADVAWANLGTSVTLAATAQWGEIERRSEHAREISLELGDHRRWEEVCSNLALTRVLYGRFERPEGSLYEPVLEAARQRGLAQSEGWGLSLWGMNVLFLGDDEALDEVTAQLEPWYERDASTADDIARLEVVSLQLTVANRRCDAAQAQRWSDEGFAIVTGLGRPTQYRALPACSLFTEALIDWWRAAPDEREARTRFVRVKRLLKELQTFAGIFPIGRPRLAWLRGRVAWYQGARDKALTAWREAHESAFELEMAWDAMLSAAALAALLPADDPERARFAAASEELAGEMGTSPLPWIPGSAD